MDLPDGLLWIHLLHENSLRFEFLISEFPVISRAHEKSSRRLFRKQHHFELLYLIRHRLLLGANGHL